jgi:hypothetical protein
MAPTGPAYHVDWVWSNTSNVHVANDRAWFTSFAPFRSHVGTIYTDDTMEVLGVGTVELLLKTHDRRSGPRAHKPITLRDVLFVPSATCNILGHPITRDDDLFPDTRTRTLRDRSGASAGLIDSPVLSRLRLVGMSAQETSLDRRTNYVINANWSEEERARFQEESPRIETPPAPPPQSITLPSLSPAEQSWLKKHHGNEWKFLRTFGFNMTKDEQRAEGRAVLKSMMAEEKAEQGVDSSEEDESADSDTNDFLADLEADPTSHMSDYLFPEKELDWIEENYRHTGNFMRVCGLKPWDTADCEKAVRIAATLAV